MSDKDEWIKRGGLPFETSEEIEKHEKCEKEIKKLVKGYGWKLEKDIQSLLHSVILVKTDILIRTWERRPQSSRPQSVKTDVSIGNRHLEFKGKLEGILKRCDLEIKEFFAEGISDDGYRRIEIRLKKIG